jgi:hypothetical protein
MRFEIAGSKSGLPVGLRFDIALKIISFAAQYQMNYF